MIETLKQAVSGWSKILGRQPDWERHFRLDAEGMNTGLVAFGGAVLIAIVLATLRLGFPPPFALMIATLAVTRITSFSGSSAKLMVPGLYLIAIMKLIEGLAALIGLPLAGAILAITGILGFRLAQANGLSLAPAIGYGLALFVLLAVLPIALYMLVNAF